MQPSAGIGTPHDALAADAPVGAERDHGLDPRLPPGRKPFHLVDRLERPAAKVVVIDGDEPLLGRPEDHRFLASPAVRIAVHQRHLVEQVARLLQVLDDPGIGREDLLAADPLGSLIGEPARRIDRAEHRELIGPARLIVLRPVAGCRMDEAGAVLDAHVAGQDDRRNPIDERVPILGMLQLAPRHRPTSA